PERPSRDGERKEKRCPISQPPDLAVFLLEQLSKLFPSKSPRRHHRVIVPTVEKRKSRHIDQQHAARLKHAVHLANSTLNIGNPLMIKNTRANHRVEGSISKRQRTNIGLSNIPKTALPAK